MRVSVPKSTWAGLLLGLLATAGGESRFQGAVEALGIEFRSTAPFDAIVMVPTGRRRPLPVAITKRHGNTSSPQLLVAHDLNQELKSVKIDFLAVDGNGRDVLLYSWRLTKAYVVEVAVSQDAKETARPQVLERVIFGYQAIEVIVGGKVVASGSSLQ